jgi:hypothetical protein
MNYNIPLQITRLCMLCVLNIPVTHSFRSSPLQSTARSFHCCTEHRGRDGMFRRMQDSYVIKLPWSVGESRETLYSVPAELQNCWRVHIVCALHFILMNISNKH